MRESGILMHITSLPSPHGVGTMGKEAYAFVDFLEKAGQTNWQILPVTPTGYSDSPYQSCSTYAGNPYLIDLDLLVQEGLLQEDEITAINWGDDPTRADFGKLYDHRSGLLKLAFSRFTDTQALDAFCRECGGWLPDFALFMALKEDHGGAPWYRWERKLKHRDPDTLWNARQQLKESVRFHSFVQYLFSCQWNALRHYAGEKGIAIIGDVPIYVPYDSADVWANPELFLLNENLDPVAVAGCPPDGFNADGQLWGNPLYRWDVHEADGYAWWIRRMAAAGARYDTVRIDHFRGFESYWAVPYGDQTARGGQWLPGPGIGFIQALRQALPSVNMIAEDLGFLTEEVLQLRAASGLPGMKVLEFAFDSREPSDYLPHTYTCNTVCYTGTHDNMTMLQWLQNASEDALAYAREYMCLNETEGMVWGAIRTAMASVSDLCVVQMQDYLELGAEGRMNFPGTQSSMNWTWRAKPGYLTDTLAERIFRLTKLYGRTQKEKVNSVKTV